ncbi:c-type cytochrome biogenesis protein CcsB [Phaeacidiphilus oryzae]|uniref:c-type cytochrome biogenesis protein CcsB n=1 Tax=Phaeacidiphilus oryzae TaxID=348818 RepID=UPI00056D0629|nr:c-type cytochrome biogenesis protein CcsB [Phaeacidiphilus oryzae]
MYLAMAVNENLAQISNYLIYSAMAVYLIAFFAYIVEWTFGSRSRVARQSAALTLGQAVARTEAEARPAARAQVTVTMQRSGGGTAVLTRTAVGKAGDVDVVSRGDAEPPQDGVGAAGGSERADMLGRMGVSLTILAALLQLGGVVTRGVSAGRPPWGNLYEFTCALTLIAALVYIGALAAKKNVRWLGLPLTTGILLGLGLAVSVLYTDSEQLVPALHSYWLWIHVSAAMVSGGALYAGAITTILYLCKDHYEVARQLGRAKGGRWSSICERLPAGASLDKFAYRINAVIFPLWTFAIIAGAIWAEYAWGHYWEWDPTETWAFITWVGYAAYLHARATAGWKGRKAAYLCLIAFACFLFNSYGVSIFINGKHSYAGV